MHARLLLPALCLAATALLGQETLPLERTREIARRANETLGPITGAPVTVDPDLDHPQAVHADKVGIMVVPDRTLTAGKLADAVETVIPVGQLWLHSAALSDQGAAVPKESLYRASVTQGEQEVTVQVCLLGAAKAASGALELLVYGTAKDPVARVPLTATEAATQSLPLELAGRKETEDSGTLTIKVLGHFTANLKLVRPPE